MSGVLLYHDEGFGTIVLDLPRSIAFGTGGGMLAVSTAIVTVPFKSTEPKGRKREQMREALLDNDRTWHDEFAKRIQEKLTDLHFYQRVSAWSLPRIVCKANAPITEDGTPMLHTDTLVPVSVLSCFENVYASCAELQNSFVTNRANAKLTRISIVGSSVFLVPPKSVFLWASINHGLDVFGRYGKFFGPEKDRLQFDVILIDPPWANRSVRHARAYKSAADQEEDPFNQALIFASQYMAAAGYVAVWVTNKASIRRQVMESMKRLHLTLAEEWVWVKITSAGEPILPVDGLWRKPYEVMLIFNAGSSDEVPRKRFIFAAPDYHSRKPNLRCLFDRLFSGSYRAIEIFARNLTPGWFSWGDEVLKYQNARYWQESSI